MSGKTRTGDVEHGDREADAVELGSEFSFPASDPPSYMGSAAVTGAPPRAPTRGHEDHTGRLEDRSTQEVFEDHLDLRASGDLEEDLRRNYSDRIVLLTVNSDLQGHEGMRVSAARLAEQLPEARFEFLAKRVNGRFALLIWRATSDRFGAVDGADSFVIEGGKIQMQAIHYHLTSSQRNG